VVFAEVEGVIGLPFVGKEAAGDRLAIRDRARGIAVLRESGMHGKE
jgi:hypothetical protein